MALYIFFKASVGFSLFGLQRREGSPSKSAVPYIVVHVVHQIGLYDRLYIGCDMVGWYNKQ